MKPKNLLTFLFLLLAVHAWAQPRAVRVGANDESWAPFSVLRDPSGMLTAQEAWAKRFDFEMTAQEVPSYGHTSDAIWIWVRVENPNALPAGLDIEVGYIDSIDFYAVGSADPKLLFHTGDRLPFDSRWLRRNTFTFPLDTGYSDFLIRSRSVHGATILPISVGALPKIAQKHQQYDLLQGIYFGFVLLITVYNFLVFLSTKESDFFYYSLYALSVGCTVAQLQGFTSGVLWPEMPWLNFYENVVYSLAGLGIWFVLHFLQMKERLPIAYKISQGMLVAYLLVAMLNLAGFPLVANQISILLSAVTCFFFFVVGIVIYLKGYKPAKYFTIAWSFFVLGVVILMLQFVGWLPYNGFTANAIQFGATAEMTTLAFAVAYKINMLKKEKEAMQAENLRMVHEQNTRLEIKVQERTQALQNAQNEVEAQNEELRQQHEELSAVNEALERQQTIVVAQKQELETALHQVVETSNRLNESLRYAQKIQEMLLPSPSNLQGFFNQCFSIYLPKDIVSGDFYWYEPLPNGKALFVMGDCTGHGVPAGFMGMIGNTLLRETVRSKGIYSPDLVLSQMRDDLALLFVKAQDLAYSDGIDMAVGLFEKHENGGGKLYFAGAKAHIFHASAQGTVRILGEKAMLGTVRKPKPFTLQQIDLQAGDWVYFYSDGLIDQDGDDRQRFSTPRLQALLEEIWQLAPQQQEQAIAQALQQHQGSAKQRDDISLIGLKM